MKKFFIILFLFTYSVCYCNAQTQSKDDKVEAVRVAYITSQLNLTPEEAQKFWPVYNKYFNEIKKAKQDNPDDVLAFQEAVVNIRKKYKGDFKTVLGSDERVNKVYTIEPQFHKMLNNELKNRRSNGQPGN